MGALLSRRPDKTPKDRRRYCCSYCQPPGDDQGVAYRPRPDHAERASPFT